MRKRTAFAAGHLRGSYGFELSDSFVTYLGWLYVWGAPRWQPKSSATSVTVLDVRRPDEFEQGHVSGAVNIVVHELADRLDELPAAEIWVHCASGYRASVAASILDQYGREVVLIDDAYTTAEELGLTEST